MITYKRPLGLVLSGGGARGAYQAGVLKGYLKIQEKVGILERFRVSSGVSAGSINAAFWGCHADEIHTAIDYLWKVWGNVQPQDVFRTDVLSLGSISMKVIRDFSLGGLKKKRSARALLDTHPLHAFLKKHIKVEKIRKNVEKGAIDYVAITASDYTSAVSVTFVEGKDEFGQWRRTRRKSECSQITINHIMASAAIPIFFEPIKVDGRYFGDGSLRNLAPLSPAIHLGAERLLIVGVRKRTTDEDMEKLKPFDPSFGRILSTLISSIFFDATELDIERLSRINHTVGAVPKDKSSLVALKPIDFVDVFPSEDIGAIAKSYVQNLPKIVRYLLAGLGTVEESSDLISYLLFEPEFCQALLDLGYQDALRAEEEIAKFLLDEKYK